MIDNIDDRHQNDEDDDDDERLLEESHDGMTHKTPIDPTGKFFASRNSRFA